MEQAIEQEDKEVEVGRTPIHVCHLTRDPLWNVRIELSSRRKRCRSIGQCSWCWTRTRKKETQKLSENHKLMEQAIEQEDKEVEVGHTAFHVRYPSRVPLWNVRIEYTRTIKRCGSICQCSCTVVNPNTIKKEKSKLLENHKLMEQSIEQEDKEVDVGRTVYHVRHLTRDPLWNVCIECSSTSKRCRSICSWCWCWPKNKKEKSQICQRTTSSWNNQLNKRQRDGSCTYFFSCLSPPPWPILKCPHWMQQRKETL